MKISKAVKELWFYALDEHPIITMIITAGLMGVSVVLCPYLYLLISVPLLIRYLK